MGFALFMARKMSLKAKINDYNLKLMQIENQETRMANRMANVQQGINGFNSAKGLVDSILGYVTLANPAAGLAGKGISALGGGLVNMFQAGQQQAIAAKQKQLDTEKQRLTTLIQKASAELQSVEQAEGQAIKNSTPKYVG